MPLSKRVKTVQSFSDLILHFFERPTMQDAWDITTNKTVMLSAFEQHSARGKLTI